MDVVVSRRLVNYKVITNKGEIESARGELKIMGDFVIIGNSVFYRPESVQPT